MTVVRRAKLADEVRSAGIIAIVRLESDQSLLEVVQALGHGGVRFVEFTLTTPHALRALEAAVERSDEDVIFGAGTVLDAESARLAIGAGAQFIVSPNVRAETIAVCHRYDVLSLPGALSPTEILGAWELGADFVKLFPAAVVGPQYVRDVAGPLPQVPLVPTGGITLDNARDFLEAGAVAVAVGSALVDRAAVARGEFDTIATRARAFQEAVSRARRGQEMEAQ